MFSTCQGPWPIFGQLQTALGLASFKLGTAIFYSLPVVNLTCMFFKRTRSHISIHFALIYAMELVNVMAFYKGLPERRGQISSRKKPHTLLLMRLEKYSSEAI